MTSLVLELQAKTVDRDTTVTELLRLAKMVAVKLELQEFEQWVNSELNGYSGTPVPPYRVLRGQMKAVNPFHGLIPVQFPDDDLAKSASEKFLMQRISEIEALATQVESNLMMPLSDEMQGLLQRLFRQNMEFKLTFQPIALVGVVDAVRNVILDWSLTLEKNGILGEGMSFSKQDKEKAHDQSVNYHIGSIGNFTGALGNVSGGEVNATTTVINVDRVEKLLTQIDQNIDACGLAEDDKTKVIKTVGEVRASIKAGTFASHGFALLSTLKGIFEHAAGHLLAAGFLHELTKILS